MIPNTQSDTRPSTRYAVPMVSGGSAYGPRPRYVLTDTEAVDLVRSHAGTFMANARKWSAFARWLVMCEQHQPLVRERIAQLQKDETVRRAIIDHVDTAINPARDIIQDICVAWRHDAKRDIKKAGTKGRRAFLKLVEESRFSTIAPAWNRQAFFLGPIIVVPVIRRQRLTFETLLPHFTEVVFDRDDPWGPPVAALWDVNDPGEDIARGGQAPPADAVLLDDEGWRYFSLSKSRGAPGQEEVSEWGQVGGIIPHGLDRFPGAVLRFDEFGVGDWWGNDPHQRLMDVTINAGFIGSVLSYVRKSQCKKLLTVLGDIGGIPKGQVLSAEKPLEADTQNPDTISVDALDFDTNPQNFITHISWLLQIVARSYGGGLKTAIGAGANLIQAEIEFDHSALTELRNEQIPHAREFERDLWTNAVAMAKANGHPLADDLPDPEKVRENFTIEFPRLARSFSSIDEEIKYWSFGLKNGRHSYGDLLREEMPLATDEERDAEVIHRVGRQLPIIDIITKRNFSLDPNTRLDAGLKTAAQLEGAKGPRVRDGEQPEETPEDTPEDEDE